MLVEGLLGALTLFSVFSLALSWTTRQRVDAVAVGLAQALVTVENLLDRPVPSIDGSDALIDAVRAEVIEVIEDVVGNLHVPTAADHLTGALAMWVQGKMMKDLGPGFGQLLNQNDAEPEPTEQALENS